MAFGYTGKILRVNLSAGQWNIEEYPENFYRQYFGGEGLIGYFLLKETVQGVDALSPSNKLIFAAGPLTGAPVGGCGRHAVGAKSPLTNAFGEAEAGGYWGAELKMAGFDAIIIEGKAETPVYLFIQDGQVSIRDASHLWGMKTLQCQEAIRAELGDSLIKVTQIGPGGEKLVRFACISNDLDAFAGRTGLGAVMGSKNLKAIACRGRQRVQLADPEVVRNIAGWIRENTPVNLRGYREFGTANMVNILNAAGGLPVRNFQAGSTNEAVNINGEAIIKNILVRRRGCYACAVQCKREVKVDEPYTVDPRYGGPEYETIGAIGSNCGIFDLKAVAKANELLAAYGLDSISCGVAISFAMECFENGILTKEDTGGLELKFGNADAMLKMIELIAQRQGIGDLLAEGVARASQKIGKGSEKLAMHIKGQELPMHEPRFKPGMGVGFSISPTGADHCHYMHDSGFASVTPLFKETRALGILDPLPLTDLSPAKIKILVYNSALQHFLNCASCCYFVMSYGLLGFDRLAQLTRAVTGWNSSVFELLKIGERAINLARIFNIREGLTAQDDTMPERFFSPHASGPLAGVALDAKAFQQAKEIYYDMMNWPNGVPSPGKLGELGLAWTMSEK